MCRDIRERIGASIFHLMRFSYLGFGNVTAAGNFVFISSSFVLPMRLHIHDLSQGYHSNTMCVTRRDCLHVRRSDVISGGRVVPSLIICTGFVDPCLSFCYF